MSSNISIVKSTGWDAAIEDAKKHIERLRGVIAACEEKKAKGEPWPGAATSPHGKPDAKSQNSNTVFKTLPSFAHPAWGGLFGGIDYYSLRWRTA